MHRQIGILITLVNMTLLPPVFGQVQDSNWSQPHRLSSETGESSEGAIVVDSNGHSHVTWFENHFDQNRTEILYAKFDGTRWSSPVKVHEYLGTYPGMVSRLDFTIDREDFVHLVWSGNWGPCFYSRADVTRALDPDAWIDPIAIQVPSFAEKLRVDSEGVLHLIYSKFYLDAEPYGVFYIRSENGGVTWSESLKIDPEIPDEHNVDYLQFEVDGDDTLHAVWNYIDLGATRWPTSAICYARSLDGGDNWLPVVKIDQLGDDPEELRLPFPGLALQGDTVHVVWSGGGVNTVGRRHRYSTDGGANWSVTQQLFGELHGSAKGDGLAFDSDGKLHFVGQVRWPQGLYQASWSPSGWSGSNLFYLVASNHLEPIGDRVHAHDVRLVISKQDQFVTTFTDDFPPKAKTLWAMHTKQEVQNTLYFPHYGDGSGLSMLLSVSNLSGKTAQGTLQAFDPYGNPQKLPFEGGMASELQLTLEPLATRTLKTLGSSEPLKTGYIRIEFDQEEVTGVAVFQFDSGLEASVLPALPGRRFSLFVERSDLMNTGFALMALSPRPTNLSLYDLAGVLVDQTAYDFQGAQQARFVTDLLDVPENFQGVMVMESEGEIVPLGLRFGGLVLSTLSVADLDLGRANTSFYFPHYGDGSGLSMLFTISNLSESSENGSMEIFDPQGDPQSLPFDIGSSQEVLFDLPPNATQVLRTDGLSVPLKTGYAEVQMTRQQTTGLAVFQFASGLEASVLPCPAGRSFGLFVERNELLDTGIAVVRETSEPVALSVYDSDGVLVESRDFDFSGKQRARYLGELFDLPEDFQGLLIMESEKKFAPLGLRFGNNVLSTIPVVGMD